MSDGTEKTENKNTGFHPFDFLLGIVDRLFKDADGKILVLRVFSLIVVFVMCLVWTKFDLITNVWTKSRFENYAELLEKEQQNKFNNAIKEQAKLVYSISRSDFAAIYEFRPNELNYFVDMIAYEGIFPLQLDHNSLGGYPIDKTSAQYLEEYDGDSFSTTDPADMSFLPTRKLTNFKYMYSCPYFNLDNSFAGTIEMYWLEDVPHNEGRLFTICNSASRVLGRIK